MQDKILFLLQIWICNDEQAEQRHSQAYFLLNDFIIFIPSYKDFYDTVYENGKDKFSLCWVSRSLPIHVCVGTW